MDGWVDDWVCCYKISGQKPLYPEAEKEDILLTSKKIKLYSERLYSNTLYLQYTRRNIYQNTTQEMQLSERLKKKLVSQLRLNTVSSVPIYTITIHKEPVFYKKGLDVLHARGV